jgi:hypothetical protein
MAITDRVRRFTRTVFGSEKDSMITKISWGYTETQREVDATSTTACMAATALGTVAVDYVPTSLGGDKTITDPDVPRVLIVKPAGTAGDVGTGIVVITGKNVEGATITENFPLTDASTTAITGKKAFKSITKVHLPWGDGGFGATVSIGVGNALGLYHRLFPNYTAVKEVDITGTTRALRTLNGTNPSLTSANEKYIELNTITPTTTPDGLTAYELYFIYTHWSLHDNGSNPDWSTSTSTSTSSTSTSTTTSVTTTSTSSTSMSTSSTSSSSSTSSTSTSSTSSSTSMSTSSTSTSSTSTSSSSSTSSTSTSTTTVM